jgi:hypothetical protein
MAQKFKNMLSNISKFLQDEHIFNFFAEISLNVLQIENSKDLVPDLLGHWYLFNDGSSGSLFTVPG